MNDAEKKLLASAQKLSDLKDKKEELEKELTEVNKAKAKLEEHTIPRMMEDFEIEKIKFKDIGTLYTQGSVRAYINVGDVEEAHQWFRDNGHGALIKEGIHWATLKSWVKEQIEEGKKVPDICHPKPYTIARIRRT